MSHNGGTRMKRLGYRPPLDVAEPEQLVLVEYVSNGRVAIVTLNRPHADNAITTELATQLIEMLETVAARVAVRVAIIAGAGDRAFSVGGDLRQRKQMTKEQWLRQRQVFDRVLYTLRQMRKPTIAAVHGLTYGGGSEIAVSTDFIIASDDAVFGQPEAIVGLSAGGGGPIFLPRVLPPGKAMQMLMTGDPLTAYEAFRLGMVNELHPKAELMAAALRIAVRIAENSPTAVQAVKRAVLMGEGEPIEQAAAIMMEMHWRSVVHPDRVEGIRAFNEDREPAFQDSEIDQQIRAPAGHLAVPGDWSSKLNRHSAPKRGMSASRWPNLLSRRRASRPRWRESRYARPAGRSGPALTGRPGRARWAESSNSPAAKPAASSAGRSSRPADQEYRDFMKGGLAAPDTADRLGDPRNPRAGPRPSRRRDMLCAAWGADAGPETETRIHHLARHAPGLESALHRPGCGALPDVLDRLHGQKKREAGAPFPRAPSQVAGARGEWRAG